MLQQPFKSLQDCCSIQPMLFDFIADVRKRAINTAIYIIAAFILFIIQLFIIYIILLHIKPRPYCLTILQPNNDIKKQLFSILVCSLQQTFSHCQVHSVVYIIHRHNAHVRNACLAYIINNYVYVFHVWLLKNSKHTIAKVQKN